MTRYSGLLFLFFMETIFAVEAPGIVDMEFESPIPDHCRVLFVTSATGMDQGEARARVKQNVIDAGGDAVVFHGGNLQIDPQTRKVISYISHAIIYRCRS